MIFVYDMLKSRKCFSIIGPIAIAIAYILLVYCHAIDMLSIYMYIYMLSMYIYVNILPSDCLCWGLLLHSDGRLSERESMFWGWPMDVLLANVAGTAAGAPH